MKTTLTIKLHIMQTISTLSLSIMESSPTVKCEACYTVNSLCIMHFVYTLKQRMVWQMCWWNLISVPH